MTITTTARNPHLARVRATFHLTATKQGGQRWTALRAFLYNAAEGRCASCGDDLAADWVVCHVIPATYAQDGERRGYVAGNLYAGCEACNDATGDDEPNVAAFANPGGVPMVWPALSGGGTGERHARALAKRAALEARGVL